MADPRAAEGCSYRGCRMTAPACPECDGDGRDMFDAQDSCPMCKGTGKCPVYSALLSMAQALVNHAAAMGYVVTIEQRSLTPLAMGNLETVIDLRAARVKS